MIKPITLVLGKTGSGKMKWVSQFSGNPNIRVSMFPEAGLHPDEQVHAIVYRAIELLDVNRPQIIITHSEVSVNWFGIEVYEKHLSSNDIECILCIKGEEPRISSYNQSGFLCNYPMGFMEPDID